MVVARRSRHSRLAKRVLGIFERAPGERCLGPPQGRGLPSGEAGRQVTSSSLPANAVSTARASSAVSAFLVANRCVAQAVKALEEASSAVRRANDRSSPQIPLQEGVVLTIGIAGP